MGLISGMCLDHLVKVESIGFFSLGNYYFSIKKHLECTYFEIIQIFHFSSHFHTLNLASTDGFCLQQLLLLYLSNGDFLFPSFHLHLLIGFYCQEESLPSHLSIYISMDSWLFIVWVIYNPILSLFILLLRSFQLWPPNLLQVVSTILLAQFYSFLEHFLTFWYHKMLKAHLVIFPAPVLESTISPRNAGLIYQKMVLRDKYLSTRFALCLWGFIASRSSHWTELGKIGYIPTCTHPHLFLYLSICVKTINSD